MDYVDYYITWGLTNAFMEAIIFLQKMVLKKFLIFSPKGLRPNPIRLSKFAMLFCNMDLEERKIMKYEVIIYWSDEDEAFIAEVPELPGCAADGSTYQEALTNVEIIVQEWIETAEELNRPIPVPKGRLIYA